MYENETQIHTLGIIVSDCQTVSLFLFQGSTSLTLDYFYPRQ